MATLTMGEGSLRDKRAVLQMFVDANDDPAQSANLQSAQVDPIGAVVALFAQICIQHRYMDCGDLLLLLLKTITILCRKGPNRTALPTQALVCLMDLIDDPDAGPAAHRQAANALQNACHDASCAQRFLSMKRAAGLGRLLESSDESVVHAAAGAIRNLTFHDDGTGIVLPWIGAVIALLRPERQARTRSRAIAIVHNATSDAAVAELVIRRHRHQALASMVDLLRTTSTDLDTRASVAGALQNLATNDDGRRAIDESGAIDLLSDLLVSAPHPAAQANAIGALWNLSGPECRSESDLVLFKAALSSCIATGLMLDLHNDER